MSEEVALAPRAELGTEAVGLLQRLIRIDTSNPPGNEAEAQSMLREVLEKAGFECELAARDPERPNLVAHPSQVTRVALIPRSPGRASPGR